MTDFFDKTLQSPIGVIIAIAFTILAIIGYFFPDRADPSDLETKVIAAMKKLEALEKEIETLRSLKTPLDKQD